MKNFLQLLSLLAITTAYCQAPKGLSIAVGGNQTFVTENENEFKVNGKTGFQAGISYAFGNATSFNYQADLLFSHNAFDVKGTTDDTERITDNIKRNSVDLQFHFNYYLLKPHDNTFYAGIQAGVFGSYGKWNADYGFPEATGMPYEGWPFYYEDVTQFNYGVSPGIILGYDDFKLSVKYNIGLSNALDGLNKIYGSDYNGRLNALTLTAYYRLF